MHVPFTFDPQMTSTVIEIIAGPLINFLIERYSVPPKFTNWLAKPAGRKALARAFLGAYEEATEHTDYRHIPLFDEFFIQHEETLLIAAHLLAPADQRQPAQVKADLLAAWRKHHRQPNVDTAPLEAILDNYVHFLQRHLREVAQFRAIMDSQDIQAIRANMDALSAQVWEQADTLARIEEAIQQILQNLHALDLLHQQQSRRPAGPDAPTQRRIQIPGTMPPNLGEIGFLSQQPLVVEEAGGPVIYTGSRDGTIHAVDVLTEKYLWGTPLPDEYQMPEAFALWRDRLLVSPQSKSFLTPEKALLLLDRATGRIMREIPLPVRQMGAPVVDPATDTAYLMGSNGTLFAVNLVTGDVSELIPKVGTYSPFPPVLVEGRLILPANDTGLRCVDLANRRVVWTVEATEGADGTPAHFMPSPLVADGMVYAANWNGHLYAVDLESGDTKWIYETTRSLGHTPLLAGDLVLVAGYDHMVHGVDRQTGHSRWVSPDLGRRIYSRPALVDGVLYVSPFRKVLHTLSLQDGKPLKTPAITLEDRVRGDLAAVAGQLVIPTRKGHLFTIQVAESVSDETIQDLMDEGRWPEAAARLVREERFKEAAIIFETNHLYYLAAKQYEAAGSATEAAGAYARDERYPESWRKAISLYLKLDQPTEAAHLYEKLEEWSDAAQAWETAGELEKAAKVYRFHLGEPLRAAQLYVRAKNISEAATVYAEDGKFNEAIALLEGTGLPTYKDRIKKLRKQAAKNGSTDQREKLLASMADREKAEFYEETEEWAAAGRSWNNAGLWQKAVDLFMQHDYVDHAIQLLTDRTEPEAQKQLVTLLVSRQRWEEALEIYTALADLPGQAQCHVGMGNAMRAADLYVQAAEAAERSATRRGNPGHVADLFAQAAAIYKAEFRNSQYKDCRRKVHHYQGRPWLEVKLAGSTMIKEQGNVLDLTVSNDGNGNARNVEVSLEDEDGTIRFSGFRTIKGIACQDVSPVQKVQVWPSKAGDITVIVRLRWIDPDGAQRQTELLEPWVLSVRTPYGTGHTPSNVVYQGDVYYSSGDTVKGNKYDGQAYHQEGDQVNITRGESSRTVSVGQICPNCKRPNSTVAAFCDDCGHDLTETQTA